MSDTFILVLNSNNVIGINNTLYQYKFIDGNYIIRPDSQICISQITIPYSWFNVNGNVYNNASFSYNWYGVGNTYVTYTVTLPSGNYNVADMNEYLQLYFITQNQYLYNVATQQNEYFITLTQNITYYTNTITCYPVPSSLPTGYTAPSGFVFSSSNYTPQFTVLSNSFGSLIGFSSGTYPSSPQASTYNTNGSITPDLSPVNSLVLISNIVNNPITSPTTILDTVPITASFGSNINYSPPYEKWVSVTQGSYSSFIINVLDQNFDTIAANDNNILISLILRQPKLISIPKQPTMLTMPRITEKNNEDNDEENFRF
jgi:hypothetical protein